MKFLYREKDNFFYGLHPFTMSFYMGSIFLMSLIQTHPVYLCSLLGVTVLAIWRSDNLKHWQGYARFTVPLMFMIMVVNALFVRAGATVLYRGPSIPVIGMVRITLEALAYGAGMGIRLLVIISIFCLFTYTVQPDRFMKLFGPFGNRTVFVITLSMRLFPLMVNDYRRIMEVQRCRGVRFDEGRWWQRVRHMFPVTSVLLLSSLERSFLQAESMYARGYGSGRRTVYNQELWRPRDTVMTLFTALALILSIGAAIGGWGNYDYYPRLTAVVLYDLFPLIPATVALTVPVFMDWGWRNWPAFRSKI